MLGVRPNTLLVLGFAVSADAYDRFMGRYSVPLAPVFADFAGVTSGQRVLDVGCGPGALTSELVDRLGGDSVVAVDPSLRLPDGAAEWSGGLLGRSLRRLQVDFG